TEEASARAIGFERTRFELAELDRAICDAEREGFVEVLTAPGSDRLLGVTLVGPEAGERIAEFTLAMQHGLGLGKILATVHPYPTRSEGNKYVAGRWRQARQPQRLLALAGRWHAWRRGPRSPHSES
ncbi:mercuric reductase, membrane-associated protein, partial [Aeromonas diversa CDC 2478-85]